MSIHKKGALGEEFAVNFLEKEGFEIIAKNYKLKNGEIDIIARDGTTIAFIEVKTRSENHMVSPLQAITPTKRKRIILTSLVFLQSTNLELQPRYDVFEIIIADHRLFEVKSYSLLKGAFDATGLGIYY